jgi:hypothetical protein
MRRRGAQVSWLSIKTKVDGLSAVWPKNHWDVFPGLGIKTGSYGLVTWSSKTPRRFLGLGLETKHAMVCLLHHKIDSRSSGLLRVEASRARVFQSGHKTSGDTTVGGARGTIMDVT